MTARPGGILALDLGARVGWAYGHPGDARPLCGAWELPQQRDLGCILAACDNELTDALALHRPALLFCEAPLTPSVVVSNQHAWESQLGLHAIARAAAYRHAVPYRRQSAYDIRLLILGRGRFPKGTVKMHVMRYCIDRNWNFAVHDTADACVAWAYACAVAAASRRVA